LIHYFLRCLRQFDCLSLGCFTIYTEIPVIPNRSYCKFSEPSWWRLQFFISPTGLCQKWTSELKSPCSNWSIPKNSWYLDIHGASNGVLKILSLHSFVWNFRCIENILWKNTLFMKFYWYVVRDEFYLLILAIFW
jgi:hypothetical protein